MYSVSIFKINEKLQQMKNILYLFLFGISLLGFGQNSISGNLKDSNQNPIANVQISIPELHLETFSDVQGNFAFQNLPSGNFAFVFTHEQYDETTQIVLVSKNNQELNIILQESHSHHIEEVVVSTAFKKVQSQNVMKVEHSSIKDLQQKGAATLMEGLTSIPGVANVSTGTSIGKPVIRGLSGNRVLVYTQGVRLENQQFGEEHGLGLNDSGIESVEVIKGPASLLYGSDALGGVLFFNPEKFAKSNSYQADFSEKLFSNTRGSNTSFGLRTSGDKFKFLVRGAYNNHGDYKIPNDSLVTNSRYEETDVKMGLSFNGTAYTTTLRYNLNQLNLGLPSEIGNQTFRRDPDFPRQGVLSQIASWHNTIYLKKSKIEANLGYISNNRKEFEDSTIPILHMHLNTLNYDLKYYFPKLGKLETIVGLQGMGQTNKNSGVEFLIPDANTKDIGVLLTSNYEWKTNVLQAGIRFDKRKITSEEHGINGEEGYFQPLQKDFKSFNASLGYKTNILQNLKLRLNVASGFRAPNLAELSSNGVHEGSNRYEIGNGSLKNEQNIQTDLNLEYGNSHLEIFANGFYNRVANYIFISPNGTQIDGFNVYDYVQSDAMLYGGEVGIHWHPHPVDWLHWTSTFETVTGKQQNGLFLPLIPANKFNNTLKTNFKLGKYVKEGYASVSVETVLAQQKISAFETFTPDYSLVNLALGGDVTIAKSKFNLNLNMTNALNRTYISHLSRLKSDGIPNMGRNIVFGINFMI